MDKRTEFEKELEVLINKYSMENGSDTPDFMLAEYLMNCLKSYNDITRKRERWYANGSYKRWSETLSTSPNVLKFEGMKNIETIK